MINSLLTPVRLNSYLNADDLQSFQIGKNILVNQHGLPDTHGVEIALIAVKESRASFNNSGCANGADTIRRHFYQLSIGDFKVKMIDAGDLVLGETIEETYQNLKMVMEYFLGQQIIPILIGGSQDSTIGQYAGYQFLGQAINIAVIDERIDLEEPEILPASRNWLKSVFTAHFNYLFNYTAIAVQGHFIPTQFFATIDKLFFDCCRLGKLKENFKFVEPELRDADLVSFDISAIKGADAPGHAHATPNGISSEEACQLARYAGISDKVTSFGIYEYNPMFDNQELTAMLIGQMIWYFIDGYCNRKFDYPITDERNFTKFIVNLNDNAYDLTFWKSKRSGRWWVEVPFIVNQKFERNQLVPCNYEDYLEASDNMLPDKWLKIFEKLA